ncbi:MAG: diguanylate cyclase [Clostridiaceae bacterium]|nr:diguanylate cyclase [Clostridiaceae bacterium]
MPDKNLTHKRKINLHQNADQLDPLTGLASRPMLMQRLRQFNDETLFPLTIALADANGFKQLNDAFGYEYGDLLLCQAAEIIKSQCRLNDLAARSGGDEFAIIMTSTDRIGAENRITLLQQLLAAAEYQAAGLSFCFGRATADLHDSEANIVRLLKQAEDDLYHQKILESPGIRGRKIHTIVQTLNETHPREEKHSRRVGWLCEQLGRAAGLGESQARELRAAGMMHDIGKIAISDTVLDKCGPLNTSEKERIKRHPEIGYRILGTVYGAGCLAESVLSHHERWDGGGYPRQLSGESIPLGARIVAIADSYDAITSDRPYRKAASPVYARHEIMKNAGSQFDPKLATIFADNSSSWS